jgi:hypothetical protein
MSYLKQWSSANPGLLIIMIDQSGSMSEMYFDGESKAVFAAKAVNNVVQTVIDRNFSSEKPKDRCRIAIIGYGNHAVLIREGTLSGIAASPKGVAPVNRKINSGDGEIIEITLNKPYWVEPKSEGGTNMVGAFVEAGKLITDFIRERPNAPAPVIISISDGQPNVGGGFDEVKRTVKGITEIPIEDGAPLVFNAHIEANSFNCRFPASRQELPPNEHAVFLFDISSVVPDSYKQAASAKSSIVIKENSRGCMISADAEALVALIDTGSSKALATPVLQAHEYETEYSE